MFGRARLSFLEDENSVLREQVQLLAHLVMGYQDNNDYRTMCKSVSQELRFAVESLEIERQKNKRLLENIEQLKKQQTTNIDISIQLPGVVHNTVINGKVIKEKD